MNGFYNNTRPQIKKSRSVSSKLITSPDQDGVSLNHQDNRNGSMSTPSDVQTELEMLKRKISMLENSVKMSKSSDDSQIWSGRPDDLSYLVGYHPYASENEEFSFHNRYLPFFNHCMGSPRHYGPLSWIALVKIDNAINGILPYQYRNVQMKRQFMRDLDQGEAQPSDKLFKDKIYKSDVSNDMSVKDLRSTPLERQKYKERINERAKAIGLTSYEGGLDSSLHLLDKIELILPNKKVIWLLLDRFFDRVVVYFPFVDEMDFLDHMERILGPRTYEEVKIDKLNVEKKTDFPQLGMLVLFLRFAYLTLFSNKQAENEAKLNSIDPSPEAQIERYLMENPIDMDILGIAEGCLQQFSFLRYCSLPIIQLALYIKLYYMYSPENGEVPEDSHSQSYTALLVNMAISLGLHRDPDNFEAHPLRNDRINNLCRKIWYYLLIFDLNGALSNGTPVCISKNLFDTKPPYHKPGNENLRNPEAERIVIETFSRLELGYTPLNNAIQFIVSIPSIPMPNLTSKLNDLEVDFVKELTDFKDAIKQEQSLVEKRANVWRTKIFFQANYFFLSINFHLFNYYEKKNNFDLAYFYLKKVIVVAVYNTMPFCEDFIENSAKFFEGTTDLITYPSFQTLAHKCMIVLASIMARARFSVLFFEALPTHNSSLLTDPDYKARYELIQRTYNLGYRCLRVITDTSSTLCSRYYYSWRCVKAQAVLRQTFNGTDFYLNWSKGKECYMKFSNEMLEDLNEILQSALEKVRNPRATAPDPNSDQHEVQPDGASTVNTEVTLPNTADEAPTNVTYNSKLPSVGPNININVPYQSQEIDHLWMLMMSEKPDRSISNLYGRTPPSMEIDFGLGTFDHLIFDNWDTAFDNIDLTGETAPENLSFLDSQNLEEIIRLGP